MTDIERLNEAIARLGREHRDVGLSEDDLGDDPFGVFAAWLEDALARDVVLPNAMTLATTDEQGRASARTVLLKGVEDGGFVFFTNRESRKGLHLAARPYAALVWQWVQLERQVTARGPVEVIPGADSDAYFATRPRGSQLAAWASNQSRVIGGRAELEAALAAAEKRFGDSEIPRPPHWGGYRLIPEEVEFWQARPNRLHDRIRYQRRGDTWTKERLSP